MADVLKKRGMYYGKMIEDMTREELMDALEHACLCVEKAHDEARKTLDQISLLRARNYG